MRIRKHGRVSAPPISPSSTSPSTDVCELNHSPWDVLSQHPQSEPEYQVVIVDSNGGGRESDYAPDSLVGLKKEAREEVVKKGKKEVKEDEERRLSLVGSVKEKGKKRVNKVKREVGGGYIQCSRNDGKKWHCKNMAEEGYTLCEHHLMKHKSYNTNHHTKSPPRKSVKKAKAATTSPTEYYYYSGFGPWWGRKRGGNEIQRDELRVVDAANQATSSSSSSSSPSSSLVQVEHHHDENDCMPDYFDFDDKESTQEEEKKMGKTRQKPIKARSLKSLL